MITEEHYGYIFVWSYMQNVKTFHKLYCGLNNIGLVHELIVDVVYHGQTSAQWLAERRGHGKVSDGTRCRASNVRLWSSFRNFIRDSEHGASVTTESYYPLGLSRGLLLGSRSSRCDEKRFLPKSIPRQNGASYPLGGEEEKDEE